MSARLRVYTYRDGLLARLAHDLQLTLPSFEVELDRGRVQARFELASLRVDGVMREGSLDTEALSERDHGQILEHALNDVLDVERYPQARFEGQLEGSAEAPTLSGSLSLRGRAEPVDVALELDEARAVARAHLVPSRWGIPPFKALGGAIKLQDAIDVELSLSRDGEAAGDWRALVHTWRAEG